MSTESATQTSRDLQELLRKSIDRAKREAPWKEDQAREDKELASYTQRFLLGEITGAEYDRLAKTIGGGEISGVIECKTLPEYTQLLRAIGLSLENWTRMAAHENEHMLEALTLGVEPVYLIRFSKWKTKDGRVQMGMYPSVSFEFPSGMSDDERRRILRQVIEAPEELSQSDKRQLNSK